MSSNTGTEVMLLEWDYNVEHAARLVRKRNVLADSDDGKILPLYICVGRDLFKRLFDSKLYVRL